MDNAVSIERRLAAMKAFHDAGVRTTCFISPIFPGLTAPLPRSSRPVPPGALFRPDINLIHDSVTSQRRQLPIFAGV